MKKTAISLILALAMVLGFVLVAAPQAEAAGTIADILVNEKDVVTAGQALLTIEEK